MCVTRDIIEFPEEGFAILRDSQGSYLAFREVDHIESLPDLPDNREWPKRWDSLKPQAVQRFEEELQ